MIILHRRGKKQCQVEVHKNYVLSWFSKKWKIQHENYPIRHQSWLYYTVIKCWNINVVSPLILCIFHWVLVHFNWLIDGLVGTFSWLLFIILYPAWPSEYRLGGGIFFGLKSEKHANARSGKCYFLRRGHLIRTLKFSWLLHVFAHTRSRKCYFLMILLSLKLSPVVMVTICTKHIRFRKCHLLRRPLLL